MSVQRCQVFLLLGEQLLDRHRRHSTDVPDRTVEEARPPTPKVLWQAHRRPGRGRGNRGKCSQLVPGARGEDVEVG